MQTIVESIGHQTAEFQGNDYQTNKITNISINKLDLTDKEPSLNGELCGYFMLACDGNISSYKPLASAVINDEVYLSVPDDYYAVLIPKHTNIKSLSKRLGKAFRAHQSKTKKPYSRINNSKSFGAQLKSKNKPKLQTETKVELEVKAEIKTETETENVIKNGIDNNSHMYQLHPNTKVSPPTKTGNSFMLYRKDKTKQLRQMFPSLNQRDISKICGELWKVASAGTKSYYQNQYKMNELSRKQLNKVDVDSYCNTPFLLGENDSNIYFEKNASNNTFNVNNYIHANKTKNVDISGISDDINNNDCCIYTSYLQ